ncbi:hypothetical protein HKX48_003184 [Thoreauomyces humboldtii]|nr:hypothetical protein HKX48_003184 [Thoreauomyces humboldtii]
MVQMNEERSHNGPYLDPALFDNTGTQTTPRTSPVETISTQTLAASSAPLLSVGTGTHNIPTQDAATDPQLTTRRSVSTGTPTSPTKEAGTDAAAVAKPCLDAGCHTSLGLVLTEERSLRPDATANTCAENRSTPDRFLHLTSEAASATGPVSPPLPDLQLVLAPVGGGAEKDAVFLPPGGGPAPLPTTPEDFKEYTEASGVYHFPNPNAGIPDNTPTAAAGQQLPDYLRLILTAQVYDVALESPLQTAHNLTSRLQNTVLLKREDLQPVFSFKCRGAYNRMRHLSPDDMKRGVVACSAGNHAQGVALAAQKLGMKATIVMPTVTPPIKWKNVKRLGAEVLLYGNDFDEAKAKAAQLAGEHGFINIPPYDDPHVIAGQGTVGVEIMRQTSQRIDAIFICIGGGGLAAGIASYVKRIYPNVKIIGVETYDAAAMTHSLQRGARVLLPQVGLFADGAAVKVVGEETFRICRELVDETILVSTDEICAGIKDAFEDTRSVVEPAGALGIAGLKKYASMTGCKGKTFVAVMSGANMNFDRLRFVAERADLGEHREALITVIIPEKSGSFEELYQIIHPRTVSEFAYRYGDPDEAHIFMSFTVQDREAELEAVFSQLEDKGMRALDASKNDMAKDHARNLVGGRMAVPDERLFRFAFPERPGSLGDFLRKLRHPLWNGVVQVQKLTQGAIREFT